MRYLFAANRLPFTLKKHNNSFEFSESAGGLSTALRGYTTTDRSNSYLWIGWPGLDVPITQQPAITKHSLNQFSSHPIYLTEEDIALYYNGFSNQTIWPLFHYFTAYTHLDESFWKGYQTVNSIFADTIRDIINPDDQVIIHDYQLMLVPQMLRNLGVSNRIGFFLHIPFPSYELFKVLPATWQQSIINGLIGADLVGFHTSSYQHNFLNTVTAVSGRSSSLGIINSDQHVTNTGVFPIGIDYQHFNWSSTTKDVVSKKNILKKQYPKQKIIVSVDRLDYSKEIINRLKGYEHFLSYHPEYREHVVFLLTLIPSRTDISQYQDTKRAIDQLIATINNRFQTTQWHPIQAKHQTLTYHELLAQYTAADCMLITPARDGMNLIAKEFIASRVDQQGVLILSKFAGAAHELSNAVLINPYYPHSIAQGIHHALQISTAEQRERMNTMQHTIQQYDINQWFHTFKNELQSTTPQPYSPHSRAYKSKFFSEYESAKRRLLLFDYDGTLVPLAPTPEQAKPTSEVLTLLYELSQDPHNSVAVISGRDRKTLDEWIGWLPIRLAAEHGVWFKTEPYSEWKQLYPISSNWKERIKPLLDYYCMGLPGSFIEEKEFSLAFHYRQSPQKLAETKIHQMLHELQTLLANTSLQTLPGNKVLEIKDFTVNKGLAAFHYLSQDNYDFILASGDDTTDEDMFSVLPPQAYTIKIGDTPSRAQLQMRHPSRLLKLMEILLLKTTYDYQKNTPRRQNMSFSG